MKLNKNWYEAGARDIHAAMCKLKNDTETKRNEDFYKAFWESEEGKIILALKAKYNSSCQVNVFAFNIATYRTSVKMHASFSIPGPKTIEDQLVLATINTSDPIGDLNRMRANYLQSVTEFYEQQD